MELPVHSVGRILLFERPLARVLNANGRGDDEHLGKGVLLAGLEQHPRDGGVDGQAGHGATNGREGAVFVEGVELAQELETTGDSGFGRGVDKGEGRNVA